MTKEAFAVNAEKKHSICGSSRFSLALVSFFGCISLYLMRINISVAIVCMTRDSVQNTSLPTNASLRITSSDNRDECLDLIEEVDTQGEFEWNRTVRGMVTSSFFVGYLLTQIIGGCVFPFDQSDMGPVGSVLRAQFPFGIRIFWEFLGKHFEFFPLRDHLRCNRLGFHVLYLRTPSDHPRITEDECDYIEQSIEAQPKKNENLQIPWFSILGSRYVWANVVADFCHAWGSYTALTSVTQYMKDVLKFDIKRNGAYNSFPYICQWLGTIVFSIATDYARSKHILSTTAARKLGGAIGILLIVVSFLDCHNSLSAVAVICLVELFASASRVSILPNKVDIAPRYSGVIMGIGNTAATIPGVIAPIVTGELTSNRQSRDRHRHRADTVHSTTATSLQDNTNRPRDPPAISDRYNWLSSTIKVYTLQTDVALVVSDHLRVSSAVSEYKCRSGVATFTVDPDLIDHACGHTSLGTEAEWQIVFITSACIYVTGGLVFVLLSSAEVQPWARKPDDQVQPPVKVTENLQGHVNAACDAAITEL
ncbi:hypothetical protein CAPTEDRAFT_204300 [Capitella teleta]|uniref:Major facilitator superfamily (MFS) profile domain-containing protein n=1 Tax=Capitella teleta TaxID=283909 RepID=R7VFC5_CAPTE|nr:hypothetical protein CAPTEDRAFT_204300 [Capitella teleta]|eukprot:ELU14375.1 hypothetical protein CAPTEDRAFT_204300 [Capitella teleta]